MSLIVQLVEDQIVTLKTSLGGIRIKLKAGHPVDFVDAVATGLHHSVNDVVAEQMAAIDRNFLRVNLGNLQQTFVDTDGKHYSVTYGPNGEATYTSQTSASASPSLSPSGSISPSASTSISPSGSLSPSASTSISPSGSLSPSASVSRSPSPSLSPSASTSISPSASASSTLSPSGSISPSASASPSP